MENEEEIEENDKKEKKGADNSALVAILILGIMIFFIIIIYAFLNAATTSDAKPIIYLYPEEETEVSVKLGNPELITCSYPKYENEWKVIAHPDGTLIDTKTRKKFIFFILGRTRNPKI